MIKRDEPQFCKIVHFSTGHFLNFSFLLSETDCGMQRRCNVYEQRLNLRGLVLNVAYMYKFLLVIF